MFRYLLKSIASMVPTFLLASVLVFSLMHLMPGDPAGVMLGDTATPEEVQALRVTMGFDKPIYVQFFRWFTGVLRGDFQLNNQAVFGVCKAAGKDRGGIVGNGDGHVTCLKFRM